MASISLAAEQAAFFDDLVRCETRLYNALNTTLAAEHGIVTSQFEFLRYLRDHPDARVADVAANFAAGIGAISKGLDRLTTRGLVRRRPNPADGRSSLLELTTSGRTLVAAAEVTFAHRLDELLSPSLTAAEVRRTTSALAALRRSLEDGRVGLPTG